MRLVTCAAVIALLIVGGCAPSAANNGSFCLDNKTPVRVSPADSSAVANPCELLAEIRDSLEAVFARGEFADHALVPWDSVLVAPITEVGLDGSVVDPTWSVHIFLTGVRYDLSGIVHRNTGEVEVGLAHKPL